MLTVKTLSLLKFLLSYTFHKGIITVVLGAKVTKLNRIYLKTVDVWGQDTGYCKLVIAWTGENDKNIRV